MKPSTKSLPSVKKIEAKYHRPMRITAKVVKVTALLVFISPFVLRFTEKATVNEFFTWFLSALGVSLFLFIGAEITEAVIDPVIERYNQVVED